MNDGLKCQENNLFLFKYIKKLSVAAATGTFRTYVEYNTTQSIIIKSHIKILAF